MHSTPIVLKDNTPYCPFNQISIFLAMFRDSQETASEHRGNKKNRIETSVSADAVAMHKCLNTL